MKLLKLISSVFVAVMLSATIANAQSGKVQAFMVKGDVMLTNNATGEEIPLARGMTFTEGYTVTTSVESSALLLFSNGSSVNVSEDSSLDITEFTQEPYDEESLGSFLRLQEDPSASKTELTLNRGEILGEVKKLSSSSTYNISTPAGSAGIRGTTYVVAYNADTGVLSIVNLDGEVVAISETDGELPIEPGKAYKVEGTLDLDAGTFTVDESSIEDITDSEAEVYEEALETIEEIIEDTPEVIEEIPVGDTTEEEVPEDEVADEEVPDDEVTEETPVDETPVVEIDTDIISPS